jgi:hypothetical protein
MLAVVCLVVGPVAGLLAANAATNPPGNGPGTAQVVLGIGVPAGLSFLAARLGARTTPVAGAWALASVVATGALLLLLIMFFFWVFQPE